MDDNEYISAVGRLVINLQSLEFALRAFLTKYNEAHEPSVHLPSLTVGQRVPVNSFTNYATLGELVDKYNDVARAKCPSRLVDRKAIELRDMLAHGRVAGSTRKPPFELLKFGKETKGQVELKVKVTLDKAWLRSQTKFLLDQLSRVFDASEDLGQGIMTRT